MKEKEKGGLLILAILVALYWVGGKIHSSGVEMGRVDRSPAQKGFNLGWIFDALEQR